MKKLNCFLIDPEKKTVEPVEVDDDLQAYYAVMNVGIIQVGCHLDEHGGDVIFVDEEGLFKKDKHWFAIPQVMTRPLCGRGLVVGTKANGDSKNAEVSLEELRRLVFFPNVDQAKVLFRMARIKDLAHIERMRAEGANVIDGGDFDPFENDK